MARSLILNPQSSILNPQSSILASLLTRILHLYNLAPFSNRAESVWFYRPRSPRLPAFRKIKEKIKIYDEKVPVFAVVDLYSYCVRRLHRPTRQVADSAGSLFARRHLRSAIPAV